MINFKKIEVGDYVCVRFNNSGHLTGYEIRGTVTKLQNNENVIRGELTNKWCFHPQDTLLEHKKKEEQ